MVRKTSHNGVYSGNTLRAFNSRYSRRYHNQACIVTRVRPELLPKLQEQEFGGPTGAKLSDDDKKPVAYANVNVAVDVALSLNKQARWLLPSALIQQVQTNNIADSELTVSVLERHKLKKTANCVSFHSNKGEVKRVQPRNGRYFGFVFPRADGKSKRTLRRERKEQLEQLLALEKSNKVKTGTGKAVEVFTEQGRAKRELLQAQVEIGESEVRYEVYYPSPASSSIAHNPKYIKQHTDVAFGDGDEHVHHGKPKKQHRGKQRNRMTLKDIEDWDVAAYHSEPHQTLTTISHMVEPQEFSSLCDVKEERNTVECLLSSLIEKAQRLQNFKGTAAKPRGKKNRACMKEDDKSHIVYLSEFQEHFVQNQKSHGQSEESVPSILPVSPMPSECTRVLLPKDDVSNVSLKECFGECYSEVGCKPRKFILDVTSSVQELLKKQGVQAKVAEQAEEAVSYLICIHDGFYNDEYDVYRVLLNSNLHEGLLSVEISSQDQQDLFRGTVMNLISQTMDFMQDLVTSLKQKKRFPLFVEDPTAMASCRHLSNHLGSSEIYVPSVKRVLQLGSTNSDITVPALSDMIQEEPVFCDVCYDDISPLTHGSAPSTSLLTCHHRVCDSCWSQHVHVRLHEGFVRVTCPGYDCQEEVKVGLLLSVAPMDTVEKLLQRQEEVRIGASQTEKWCPNESCGRVISLKPSSSSGGSLQCQQDVVCACGTHVCFHCMMSAHWPASCQQAEDYRASLDTAVFPDRLAEIHDDYKADELAREKRKQQKRTMMLVEGKHCPRCKSFVFKNGGCPQMTCRCGQMFCWYCAKPGNAHHGCIDEKRERKVTTTIVIHHIEQEKKPDDTEQQKQSTSGNRRRRMSMMERAVEHRKHRENSGKNSRAIATLAKAVTSAAAKNKALTQHLAKVCSGACPASVSQRSVTVLEMISTFLKNAQHSRHELLEVVEYSMVLLKDLPDSLLRRRALRVSEDLSAFCSFSQSIFDVWGKPSPQSPPQGAAVKALMRLAEIQDWVHAALSTHVVTVKKLRGTSSFVPGRDTI